MVATKAAAKAAAFLKQKKYRSEMGSFLVEGLRNVEEAVASGTVQRLFYVPVANQRLQILLQGAQAKGIETLETTANLLEQIADTATPQGIIAVCRMPKPALAELFAAGKMLLVLDRVQDPGNLGTIIRTADAAGLGGIISLAGTVDAYNPKVVRSAMGSLFHLPLIEDVKEAEFLELARKQHYLVVATALAGAESVFEAKPGPKIALILGNEANGVSNSLLRAAEKKYFIPMKGSAESLNVAMAAGIMMFQLNR